MLTQKRHAVGVSPLNDKHQKETPPLTGGIQIRASILVARSPESCYRHWRNFQNLPRFMSHVQSVTVADDRHSHWVVEGPANSTVEWDAEIIEDAPPERISWRSLEKAQVDNAGSVSFSPRLNGRQTEVKVELTYNPPAGALGEFFVRLFGESPQGELSDDLKRFKEAVESEG